MLYVKENNSAPYIGSQQLFQLNLSKLLMMHSKGKSGCAEYVWGMKRRAERKGFISL